MFKVYEKIVLSKFQELNDFNINILRYITLIQAYDTRTPPPLHDLKSETTNG